MITVTHEMQAVLKDWYGLCTKLLDKKLPQKEGHYTLEPRTLTPTDEATNLWKDFADEVEDKQQDGGEYASIRGFASKLAEHALRLTGIVQYMVDDITPYLHADSMQAGIALARFYVSEALRLMGKASENANILLANKISTWLLKQQETYTCPADVQQNGPVRNVSTPEIKQALQLLVEHHWLIEWNEPVVIRGKKRKQNTYRLNPKCEQMR